MNPCMTLIEYCLLYSVLVTFIISLCEVTKDILVGFQLKQESVNNYSQLHLNVHGCMFFLV